MDYESARRIRSRSVKELTIRNIQQGGSIVGSYKSAIGSKFTASATRIKEKFDPLNYISMLNSPLTTAIVGRLFGRKGSTIRYFTEKQEAREREKQKNTQRTKIGPGRTTRLKVGDSSADILAKMFNLLQKDHDESLKRWELEQQHNQERKDKEDKRHQELLNAISKMGIGTETAKKTKGKSFFQKLKEEMVAVFEDLKKGFEKATKFIVAILDDVWIAFKDIFEGVITIFEFLGRLGTHLVRIVFDSVIGLIEKIAPGVGMLYGAFKTFKNKVLLKFIEHAGALRAIQNQIDYFKKIFGVVTDIAEAVLFKGKGKKVFSPAKAATAGAVIATNPDALDLVKKVRNAKDEGEKQSAIDEYYEKHKDVLIGDSELMQFVFSLSDASVEILDKIVAPGADEGALNQDKSITRGVLSTVGRYFSGFSFSGFSTAMHQDWNRLTDYTGKNVIGYDSNDILYYGPEAINYLNSKGKNLKDVENNFDPNFAKLYLDYQKDKLVPVLAKSGVSLDPSTDKGFIDKDGNKISHDELLSYIVRKHYAELKAEEEKKKHRQTIREISKFLGMDDEEFAKWTEEMNPGKLRVELNRAQDKALREFEYGTESLSEVTEKLKGSYEEVFKKGGVVVNKVTNNIPIPPEKEITEDAVPSVRTEDPSLLRCQMNSAIAC